MLASYLLTLYRSLIRHKLYSALNVLGFAVGIAAFVVLMLAFRFEQGYDQWIPNADNIHRVDSTITFPGTQPQVSATTPGHLMDLLRADFPAVTEAVRLMPARIAVRQQARSDYEDLVFADASFFRVFDLPLVAGSKTALSQPTNLVLTQTMARKYFGDGPAVGRPLTLTVSGEPRNYTVAAVLKDLPENTHLSFAAVAPLDPALFPDRKFDSWGNIFVFTYLVLPDRAARAALDGGLDDFMARRAPKGGALGPNTTMTLGLQPVPDIHFGDVRVNDAFRPGVDRLFVLTLGLVGLTTLFIAGINYVNLATARAGLRAREVALRKVMGATRAALIVQFLVESVVMTLLAGLLGVALAELALPVANSILATELELTYFGEEGLVLPLAAILVFIGLAAGLYPALVLSRFQPAAVLAASRSSGGGRRATQVREGLVALQFAVSIAMIVCTAVIWGQTAYLRNADIGYEREGLILVSGLEEVPDRLAALDDAFRQLPGVAGVTMSTRAPGDSQVLTARATRPGGRDQEMRYEMTGADYFRTYGIRIVSGRDFDNAHRADDIAGSKMAELQARGANIIVNERAARLLGYRSAGEAAGASIDFSGIPSTIIGVARDTRFGSPREPVAPVIYMRNTNDGRFAVIRHRGDGATMMRRLEAAWRQAAPGTPFQAATLEQTLAAFYEPDERRSRLFAAGAVLAVLIGCIGLYGLASFTADRRTKEIGLRKVLGAAAMDILRLLVVQFMRPVVLANLIAWPLAFLLMRAWLSGFDQSISLSPVYFLLATGAALAVALTTIIGEAYKLARADPVQALRHE